MKTEGTIAIENKCAYFLATTAIEKFWDTRNTLVFLGEWCRRYSRKGIWEPLNGKLLPSVWCDPGFFDKSYEYTSLVYEKFLSPLAANLNKLHGEKLGNRSWRIIVGPWLFHFIHLAYDRYCHLKKAFELYPEISSVGLHEDSFLTPSDMRDYLYYFDKDLYNLQIMTRIFDCLGRPILKKSYAFCEESYIAGHKTFNPAAGIKEFGRTIFFALEGLFQNRSPVILHNAYFNAKSEVRLFIKTGCKVCRLTVTKAAAGSVLTDKKNISDRDALGEFSFNGDEFEEVLKELIPAEIPFSYVENFQILKKSVMKYYPKNTKFIFSADSWYCDELFKIWAALLITKGARLMGIQHGGNYGSLKNSMCQKHEIEITDKFYSWGWKEQAANSKVVPFFASKLAGYRKLGVNTFNKDILFVSINMPRYSYRIQCLNIHEYCEYLNWQVRFLSRLPKKLLGLIRFRLFKNDFGWDIEQRLATQLDFRLRFDDTAVPFLNSLKRCRLFVTDHLSTTFLEALSMDKPTILFWDPAVFQLTKDAVPYYELLRSAGILFFSPEEAAQAVETSYAPVGEWWNEPNRKKIREEFLRHFALTSRSSIDAWAKELMMLLKGPDD